MAQAHGKHVTGREKETLEYALKAFKFTDKAKTYFHSEINRLMHGHLHPEGPTKRTKSPAKTAKIEEAHYKTIDGVKYDRALLEAAEKYAADGQVSFEEAHKLFQMAQTHGKHVTGREKETLEYALKAFKFTDKAKTYFNSEINRETHGNNIVKCRELMC